MKKLLLFGALALSLNSFAQVPNYVPTNGLVSWYAFIGNANDESGNGNDGIVNGATLTIDRFGGPNSAYAFDGSTNYIDIGNAPELDRFQQDFTISAWVKTPSLTSSFSQTILSNRNGGNGGSKFGIVSTATIGQEGNLIMTGGSDAVFSSDSVWLSVWTHVVVTYNYLGSNNNIVNFYIDGQLKNDIDNVVNDIASPGGINTFLGYEPFNPVSSDYFFEGDLDDIGIWNSVLTACEIQDLYNSQLNSTVFTATQSGTILTADQSGATYQWLYCDNNAIINGETNQSYTPAVTGNYAVEVTLNGCVDTSACFLVDFTGLDEINSSAIKVYPNPTKESFNIEVDPNVVGSNYFIYDQLGKFVQNGVINNPSQRINVAELSKGIYNLKIDNSDIQVKLIKE